MRTICSFVARLPPHDPWLSAAEIATASAAGRVSRHVRKARNELRHAEFSAKDATELAAAVGSVELAAGNISQSKKLFRISLEQPNENSLAQAEWSINHRGLPLEIPRECVEKIGAFEAAAIDAFGGERWQVCADALWKWMQDQPVLVEPALTGSVVACDLLEDNRFAIAFTQKGLQSNPSEPLLYNNQAVAYARMYQLDDAQRSLDKAVALADQEDEYRQTVLMATRGLLAFRSRNPEAGRIYYRNAIHMAVAEKRVEIARRAYIFWLQEEVFLRPSLASSVLQTMKPVLRVPNSSDFYKSVTGVVSHRLTTLARSAPSVSTAADVDFEYPPQLAVS